MSAAGIEVDRAKIEVMIGLPAPTNEKDVRKFLGHADFTGDSYEILAKSLDLSPPSSVKKLNSTSHQNA